MKNQKNLDIYYLQVIAVIFFSFSAILGIIAQNYSSESFEPLINNVYKGLEALDKRIISVSYPLESIEELQEEINEIQDEVKENQDVFYKKIRIHNSFYYGSLISFIFGLIFSISSLIRLTSILSTREKK